MTNSFVPGSLEKSRSLPSENVTRTWIGDDVGMEMGLCMDMKRRQLKRRLWTMMHVHSKKCNQIS